MYLACDPSALLILQRHHAVGKPPESGCPAFDHPLEFNCVFPNRLLEQLAIMNIGTCTIPLENVSVCIANWHRTRSKPAILRVRPTEAIVTLVALARLYAIHPS